MTTGRAAGLVMRWVRHYTRHLPEPIAERRIGEIESDLHDHIAYARTRGTGDWPTALSVLSRLLRGAAADVSWRAHIRRSQGDPVMPLAGILVGALAAAALGVLAVLYGSGDDSPGMVLIGVLLITAAIALSVRSAYRRGKNAAT